MKVLQQSFFLLFQEDFGAFAVGIATILACFGYSKASPEVSHGFLWITFQFLNATQFFYLNNGFPASFFAASSTAF